MVKRKATGPVRQIGTLFFNPGGPGGPGTVQKPQNYGFFPKKVRERFDIVSWVPRRIGNSTAVNCFASPEEAEASDDARLPTFLRMGSDRSAAATLEQFLDLCGSRPAQCASPRVARGPPGRSSTS
ncbi:hypothetical protein AB0D33_04245 [Streptomyces sp. NPDC048404]|uniref:hypothetical protein n=1 Tax=unclassified Streptomyces TaxID=2593676 RepID=UPI00342F9B08